MIKKGFTTVTSILWDGSKLPPIYIVKGGKTITEKY